MGGVLGAPPPESTFVDRDAALAALYPGETVLETVEGDLDGDGRPDLAVALSPTRSETGEDGVWSLLRVVVFKRDARGLLQRWAATGVVHDCRHSTALSIAKGALFLGCTHHLGIHGGENFSQHLRFADRRGTLRLVGDDTESVLDMNGPTERFETTSRNLLTGEVVVRPYKGRERRSLEPDSRARAVPLSEWEGW